MTWLFVLLLLAKSLEVAKTLELLYEPRNMSVTVGSSVFQPCVCNCQLLPYWKINATVYAINNVPVGFLVNATGLLFTNVQLHHSGTVIQCLFFSFENSSFQTIESRKGVLTVHAACVALNSEVLPSSVSKVSELKHTTVHLPTSSASSMRTSIKNGLQIQVTPTGLFTSSPVVTSSLPVTTSLLVTSSLPVTSSPLVTIPIDQPSHTISITQILYQAVIPVAAGIVLLAGVLIFVFILVLHKRKGSKSLPPVCDNPAYGVAIRSNQQSQLTTRESESDPSPVYMTIADLTEAAEYDTPCFSQNNTLAVEGSILSHTASTNIHLKSNTAYGVIVH